MKFYYIPIRLAFVHLDWNFFWFLDYDKKIDLKVINLATAQRRAERKYNSEKDRNLNFKFSDSTGLSTSNECMLRLTYPQITVLAMDDLKVYTRKGEETNDWRQENPVTLVIKDSHQISGNGIYYYPKYSKTRK